MSSRASILAGARGEPGRMILDQRLASVVATSQRIALDRPRRKVLIAVPPRLARFRLGAWLIAADLIVLTSAFSIRCPSNLHPFAYVVRWSMLAAPVLLATYILGGYRLDAVLRTMPLKVMALAAGAMLFVALVVYKLVFQDQVAQPDPVMVWTFAGLMAAPLYGFWVGGSRLLVRALLARRESRAALLHIGPLAPAIALRRALRGCGLQTPVIAFLSGDEKLDEAADEPEAGVGLARAEDLDACLEGSIKAIVLSVPPQGLPARLLQDLVHARLLNIPIQPPSLLFEELWERTPVAMDDPSWLLQDEKLHPARSLAYQGAKRVIDVVVAAAGLLGLFPVMMAVAIAVRLTSPGPAMYSQRRVGRWKHPFTIYKFRTMNVDAEAGGEARWATQRDPRVTPIGRFLRKTRLDELPQLWNVLIGNMSLVGPRPERPEFTSRLEELVPYYDIRHLVKPGLTGWAQVRYPYGASVEDALAKLEYEIYYIKHASLRFDVRILMRTLGTVIGLRGR